MVSSMLDHHTLCLTMKTSKGVLLYKFYFNNTFVTLVSRISEVLIGLRQLVGGSKGPRYSRLRFHEKGILLAGLSRLPFIWDKCCRLMWWFFSYGD